MIETRDFIASRLAVIASPPARYIVFVDDDDTIPTNSLLDCWHAMNAHAPGVVCTNERTCDLEDKTIYVDEHLRTYDQMCNTPLEIHHMCLIDTQAIDVPGVVAMAAKHTVGVDWFIKASAGSLGNVVHVPIVGYNWTRHPGQMCRAIEPVYLQHLPDMREDVASRWGRTGNIPTVALNNW